MNWLNELLTQLLASRLLAVVFLVASIGFTVFMRYGGGEELAAMDVAFAPFNRPPELVAQSDMAMRRIVVAPDGMIYAVLHPKFQRDDMKVVVIDQGGDIQPFPNEDWQRVVFTNPTAVTIDGRGYVWITEDDPLGFVPPRVLAIDTNTGKLVVDQEIERNLLPRGSMLSDIVLSPDGMHVVLSDASPLRLSSRLLHFNLHDATIEAKLVRHSSVRAARYKAVVDGVPFSSPFGLRVHREGANAVAFSSNGTEILYASASNDGLFTVPTDVFLTSVGEGASPIQQISKRSTKPWTEAITTDVAGNVYMADAANGRVIRRAPNGTITAVVPLGTFVWPSGLAFGPDGKLYVSETALNQPRWRVALADVLAEAPFGLGRWLVSFVKGDAARVGGLGVWRLDVGVAGVLG